MEESTASRVDSDAETAPSLGRPIRGDVGLNNEGGCGERGHGAKEAAVDLNFLPLPSLIVTFA